MVAVLLGCGLMMKLLCGLGCGDEVTLWCLDCGDEVTLLALPHCLRQWGLSHARLLSLPTSDGTTRR